MLGLAKDHLNVTYQQRKHAMETASCFDHHQVRKKDACYKVCVEKKAQEML